MASRIFNVDFDKKQGKIKPLNAINGGPMCGGASMSQDMSAEYRELSPALVRCVMPDGSCGYNQFICVHAIFPDISRDVNDENAYNFAPTDEYLSKVKDVGCDIFYTLGETAEPWGRPSYARMPADAEKWASVCEHIVMHYNEGWANGFKWNIKYLEIWNGADRPDTFCGEREEFFELYRVTSNRLKERFPRIKIGGYGAMGFSSLNRINSSDAERCAVSFMEKFFSYIRKEETRSPLDFFTWKCYANSPEELAMHAKYARAYLDNAGLKKTKSIVAEFNLRDRSEIPPALRGGYPAGLATSLILAQKSSIDTMFYSASEPHHPDNALYTVDDCLTHRKYAAFEVMESFSSMYSLGYAVEVSDDFPKEAYLLAAKGDSRAILMLACRAFEDRVEIHLRGSEYESCSVKRIASGAERGEGRVYRVENLKIAGGRIVLSAKKNEVYIIELV